MSQEAALIAALRGLATHPGARGLLDDAAVLEFGGERLVLTHDMLVEGVHFLPDDPAGDVAWKLLAVNLSDLAAKGAKPAGVLMGYTLTGNADWDAAFVGGLGLTLEAFDVPLLGGDTVSAPQGAPRTLSLTALGTCACAVPSRSGARAGDQLWVTGTIGDAGAGLRLLQGGRDTPAALVERYRRPSPRIEAGQALAPLVTAMMDVSDGLLIDASRLSSASGAGLTLELGAAPLSQALLAEQADSRATRLTAATAGDDYELLFAAAPEQAEALLALSAALGLPFTRIGAFTSGTGPTLTDDGTPLPLPPRLGWEHGSVSG
jgi:thiamine-monophosphate kinase